MHIGIQNNQNGLMISTMLQIGLTFEYAIKFQALPQCKRVNVECPPSKFGFEKPHVTVKTALNGSKSGTSYVDGVSSRILKRGIGPRIAEVKLLEKNEKCKIVSFLKDRKAMNEKQEYDLKRDGNQKILKNTSRIVGTACSQVPGIDVWGFENQYQDNQRCGSFWHYIFGL